MYIERRVHFLTYRFAQTRHEFPMLLMIILAKNGPETPRYSNDNFFGLHIAYFKPPEAARNRIG